MRTISMDAAAVAILVCTVYAARRCFVCALRGGSTYLTSRMPVRCHGLLKYLCELYNYNACELLHVEII